MMIQKISSLIYCIGHSGEVKKVNIYRKLIMESLLDGQKTINEKYNECNIDNKSLYGSAKSLQNHDLVVKKEHI